MAVTMEEWVEEQVKLTAAAHPNLKAYELTAFDPNNGTMRINVTLDERIYNLSVETRRAFTSNAQGMITLFPQAPVEKIPGRHGVEGLAYYASELAAIMGGDQRVINSAVRSLQQERDIHPEHAQPLLEAIQATMTLITSLPSDVKALP